MKNYGCYLFQPLAAEIERRLKWVKDIMTEPQLLQPGMENRLLAQSNSGMLSKTFLTSTYS